jgi:hypothetical protein
MLGCQEALGFSYSHLSVEILDKCRVGQSPENGHPNLMLQWSEVNAIDLYHILRFDRPIRMRVLYDAN